VTREEIERLYPGGRWTRPDHYETRCPLPAHERGDRRPGLGFTWAADGRILVYCQKGCATEDVLGATGLTMADLAPPSLNGQYSPGRTPEAVYVYRDAVGEAVAEKLRLPGKKFSFRLPGRLEWGLQGLELPLYHLPELLATQSGDLIGIAEGEKDVERLTRAGLPATTNPHGAAGRGKRSKWKQQYTDWLKENLADRKFLIFADQDEAGLAHAESVYESLSKAGLSVRVADMPGIRAGEDVSDWLGRHSEAEFQEVLKPPPHPLTLKLLSRDQLRNLPPPVWQIEDFFFEQSIVEMYGENNHGKSLVGMDIALNIVRGGSWAGRAILKPGAVVYVNADGGPGFSPRLRAWEQANGTEATYEFWTYPTELLLRDPRQMSEFSEGLSYLPDPPVMLFIDTLSQCIPGVNENQQEEMSLVVSHLNAIKRRYGTTIVLLHHVGKDGMSRGSTVIPGAADTIIRIAKQVDELVELVCDKQRDGRKFEPFGFTIEHHGADQGVYLAQAEASHETRPGREDLLLDLLRQQGDWLTREQIGIRTLALRGGSLHRALKKLVTAGLIQEEERQGDRGAPAKIYRAVPGDLIPP